MRLLLVGFALLTLSFSTAMAGPNASATLVLHALPGTAICPYNGPDPCDPGPPTTTMPSGAGFGIMLFARNYDNLAGVQCAFEFPFPFTFGLWSCQVNQVAGTTPTGSGTTAGTISTAFDCVTGGATAAIGSLNFATAFPGCATIIESSFPFATHVISCVGDVDPIPEVNRGMVCVDSPGTDTCEPVVPVEATTWGSIKAQYQ